MPKSEFDAFNREAMDTYSNLMFETDIARAQELFPNPDGDLDLGKLRQLMGDFVIVGRLHVVSCTTLTEIASFQGSPNTLNSYQQPLVMICVPSMAPPVSVGAIASIHVLDLHAPMLEVLCLDHLHRHLVFEKLLTPVTSPAPLSQH